MTYSEQLVEGPNGRTLEVATMGNPSGASIYFHHGTPGSTRLLKTLSALIERTNLFFITTSRAGYGNSTRHEGRSVGDVVADVRAVMRALDRGRYGVMGWSGGGPHALACAALDPLCLGAWSIAGVAPIDADINWTEGMGPENLEEFALAQAGGPVYEAHIAQAGAAFGSATKDTIVELFGELLSEPDRRIFASDEVRAEHAEAMSFAFANGASGLLDDDQAFMKPWGFDVASIDVPVSIWYGDADLMVPPTHGSWLVGAIRSAQEHRYPSEGHISIIFNHVDELATELTRAFEGVTT